MWPTSFMTNQCYCVMYKFWMPSKYTTRDIGFGYFLECDLKRKTESLGIVHFRSPLLHLEQLRCPRSHISAPHSSSFLLETLLSEVCVIHPIFLFFFTLRSLKTWHKDCLKFEIIAVFPFLTDWHFFNGSKFYYFHAFYYKLHRMISTKISHHFSF